MRTRTMTWVLAWFGVCIAVYQGDIAAAYVAVLFGFVGSMLHTLEVKLNKLLDAQQIYVSPADIDRE